MAVGRRTALVAFVFLALFYASAVNNLLEGGDAERYVIFGRSILERGDIILLSHPREPYGERYGPLYPSLIAFFFALFGYSLYAAKMVSLLAAIAGVYATYLLVRELGDRETALVVALLVAVNPQMLQYSHKIMTESTFLLTSVLGLLFSVRYASKPEKKLNLVAAGLFIAASAMTKSVGIILLGSVLLFFLARRNVKACMALIVLFVIFMSPWYVRNLRVFGSPLHSNYGSALDFSAYSGAGGLLAAGSAFTSNMVGWVGRLIPENIFPPLYLVNLKQYSVRQFAEGSLGFLFRVFESSAMRLLFMLAGLLVSGLVFYGMIKRWRKIGSVDIFFVAYILFFASFFVFATDPILWAGERESPRFIVPILPLAFYYFVSAIRGFCGDSKKMLYAVVAVIVAASLAVDGVLILKAQSGFYIPVIQNQWEAGVWARENTPADSVFLVPLSKGFYLNSGRKVVDLESDRDITFESAVLDYGIDYVVAPPGDEKITFDHSCLSEVYSTGEPEQVVYEVVC